MKEREQKKKRESTELSFGLISYFICLNKIEEKREIERSRTAPLDDASPRDLLLCLLSEVSGLL